MSDTTSVRTAKRGLFGRTKSSGPKEKIDYKVAAKEEKLRRSKTTKNSNPLSAMQEAEPFAQAQSTIPAVSQLKHKDQYGNEIVDPDRSNPTRSRMERPLDTIRAFERSIYQDSRESNSRRHTAGAELSGHYRKGPYDAQAATQSMTGSPGMQRNSQSFENASAYQDAHLNRPQQYRARSMINDLGYGSPAGPSRGYQNGQPDTHSDSYNSGEISGSNPDHYSTDPSSETSSYGNREYDNYTTAPQKTPSPLSRGQNVYNQQNPYNGTYGQQQQQPQQHGDYEPQNGAGEYFNSRLPAQTYNQETGYYQDSFPAQPVRETYQSNPYPYSAPSQPQQQQQQQQQQQYQTPRPQVAAYQQPSYTATYSQPQSGVNQQGPYQRSSGGNVLMKMNSGALPSPPATDGNKRKSWFRRSKSVKS